MSLRSFHRYGVKSPRDLSRNSQNEIFLNISKNHPNMFYIYSKISRFSITLAKIFKIFFQYSKPARNVQALQSYLHPPSWKIVVLALLVIWNTFFKWKIAKLDCLWHRTEYCFKKMAGKTQG